LEYEKLYFEDFTFQPDSIAGDLLLVNTKYILKKDRPKRAEYWGDMFQVSIEDHRLRIKAIEGIAGRCEGKLITIHPDRIDSLEIILHEMIHAYENMLSDDLKELLYVRLYAKLKANRKLKRQIPDLNYSVLSPAHHSEHDFFAMSRSAYHDTLFFLKSLDLDLRLGLPVGTVYGY
jgi:hypothetical protein